MQLFVLNHEFDFYTTVRWEDGMELWPHPIHSDHLNVVDVTVLTDSLISKVFLTYLDFGHRILATSPWSFSIDELANAPILIDGLACLKMLYVTALEIYSYVWIIDRLV